MKCKFIIVRKYTDDFFGHTYIDVPFIFPEKINHYGFAQTIIHGNLSEIHSAGYCEILDNEIRVYGSGDTVGVGIKYNSAEILNKWYFNHNSYYTHSM